MSMSAAYTIAAMGDIMLARTVGERFLASPADFGMEDISGLISGHDLVFANLENPASAKGTPHAIQDPNVTFCAHPDSLQVLKNLGVTAVSLANNHMLDYGEEALLDTIVCLNQMKIHHFGAGRCYQEANQPALLECNGVPVAIVGTVMMYSASTLRAKQNSPGVADHRLSKILAAIKKLRADGYHVLVSVHWGQEYTFYPIPYQMRQARQMIDAGASLILGHGPHYPQGIETYKNGQIVYSLGNFVFDEPFKYANYGFVFSAGITASGEVVDSRVRPVEIQQGVPSLVDGHLGKRIERVIVYLGSTYPAKDKNFWKSISNWYFRDIIRRVTKMGSFKFLLLPPLSFYSEIGLSNLFKKLSLTNLLWILRRGK